MYCTEEPDLIEQANGNKIMDILNDMTMNEKNLAAAMSHNHRTLQQNFTRLAVAWIEYLANLEENEYDLRNEASVMLAKQLVATPEWEKRKFLPYV